MKTISTRRFAIMLRRALRPYAFGLLPFSAPLLTDTDVQHDLFKSEQPKRWSVDSTAFVSLVRHPVDPERLS
ncbi:MAG: hypothetical protein IAF08_01880 [Rhizobacter sp.]|nr:hypothetical protein [Chlorobiales bacterium]